MFPETYQNDVQSSEASVHAYTRPNRDTRCNCDLCENSSLTVIVFSSLLNILRAKLGVAAASARWNIVSDVQINAAGESAHKALIWEPLNPWSFFFFFFQSAERKLQFAMWAWRKPAKLLKSPLAWCVKGIQEKILTYCTCIGFSYCMSVCFLARLSVSTGVANVSASFSLPAVNEAFPWEMLIAKKKWGLVLVGICQLRHAIIVCHVADTQWKDLRLCFCRISLEEEPTGDLWMWRKRTWS